MKTLETQLRALSIGELMRLAFRLQAMPPERADRKSTWVEIIRQAMENTELMCHCVGYDNLRAIRAMVRDANRNGRPNLIMPTTEQEYLAVRALYELCLVHFSKKGWAIQEPVKRIAAHRASRELQMEEQIYNHAMGWLSAYALLPSKDLLTLVERELPGLTEEELMNVLLVRCGTRGIAYQDNQLMAKIPLLYDAGDLMRQWEIDQLSEEPWMTDYFSMEDGQFQSVSRLLRNYGTDCIGLRGIVIKMEEAGFGPAARSLVIKQAVYRMQEDMEQEATELLLGHMPWEGYTTQRMVQNFLSDLPLWRYRGASFRDMRAYRDWDTPYHDLCPCGSGKTYITCHGRYN